jgi:hypothetical protein
MKPTVWVAAATYPFGRSLFYSSEFSTRKIAEG